MVLKVQGGQGGEEFEDCGGQVSGFTARKRASGREVCKHHSRRATLRAPAVTWDISLSGRAVRQGKHLNAGKKHQRPRLVKTYVSDLLIAVNSWQADSLAYTSDRACSATMAGWPASEVFDTEDDRQPWPGS